MYETIPMYIKHNVFVKCDKFLLIYCIHVPTKYIKEEKKQIRKKEKEYDRVKLKQSQKLLFIQQKRYNKKVICQRRKTIEY